MYKMELLLKHIEANWGKMPACGHCAKPATFGTMFCAGPCVGTLYCNKQCQSNDWPRHHVQCVGAKTGDKRGRDGDDENGGPSKKIDLKDLPNLDRDVWSLIAKYLNLQDLKNLSLVEKRLARVARQRMFDQYWIVAPETPEQFQAFLTQTRRAGLTGFIRYFSYVTPAHLHILYAFNEIELHGLWFTTYRGYGHPGNIQLDQLPASLKVLKFHRKFNQPITRLPSRLQVLEFGADFDEDIQEYPADLQRLTFGHGFNRPVNNLPMSIEYLQFGAHFNQFVENWPINLKILILGRSFNQLIDNLPDGLNKLNFSLDIHADFNTPVNRWPAALEELVLSARFNRNLANLPPTLKSLTLGRYYVQPIDGLPEQLETLTLGIYDLDVVNWPPALKELHMPIDSLFNQSIDDLPDTVEIISIGRAFFTPVNKVPQNLETVYLAKYWKQKRVFPVEIQEKLQPLGALFVQVV